MINRDNNPIEAPIDEIWKFIPGCPSVEISNYGRARCYLKLDIGKLFKYPRLGIKGRRQAVHRWVSELFLGPRPEGLVVNHKDGNPGNNHINNLEYITQKENIRHGRHAKLNPNLVRAIRTDFATLKVTKRALAKKYGVTDHQIGVVVLGRQWEDVV